jgi:transcriptional regulator with XRE-family HTH domain
MIRVGAGLTTENLAHEINVDRSLISRIESGNAPLSSDVIADWVSACGGNVLLSWAIESFQAMQTLADLFSSNSDHPAYV